MFRKLIQLKERKLNYRANISLRIIYKTQVIQNIPEDTEDLKKSVNNCRK